MTIFLRLVVWSKGQSKRVGLLIEAMKYVKADIQFKIAGT